MADKLMYITNGDTQNYPFRRLVVQTIGHLTQRNSQSKFNKCPQSCLKAMNKKTLI